MGSPQKQSEIKKHNAIVVLYGILVVWKLLERLQNRKHYDIVQVCATPLNYGVPFCSHYLYKECWWMKGLVKEKNYWRAEVGLCAGRKLEKKKS